MDNVPTRCACGCEEFEKADVYTEEVHGRPVEVEYKLYCKNCGKYLGSYAYGHWSTGQ